MKQFEILYESHVTIKAEDFEDARKKFIAQFPIPVAAVNFHCIDTGEEKAVIGHSEMSELPIFEDEDFLSDGEGVMWLKREDED